MLAIMHRLLPFGLFVFGIYAPAMVQLSDADDSTKAKCNLYLQTPLPAEGASIGAPKAWPACNSYRIYSGIGSKVDYLAARTCAWSERLANKAELEPRYSVSSVLGGSAMLSVLYANGEGVSKNIPLALRFSCESEGAPAEVGHRIEHLESLQGSLVAPAAKFSFCDDITSGFMDGFCSAYQAEIAGREGAEALSRFEGKLPQIQRTAFIKLARAEQAYAKAHGSGEIDLSGTSRAAEEIEAEQSLNDNFLKALNLLEQGQLPTNSQASFESADVELNRMYQASMAAAEAHKNVYGAIQPVGIRNAERAWILYRDSWIAFATEHYPSISADTWRTILTRERTSILANIL